MPRTGHAANVRHLVRWLLLALPAAALVYAGGLSLPGLSESGDALGRVGGAAVVGSLLLEVGALLTLAEVYRASLRAVGADLPYRPALGVSMSAFTVSRIVPGGGAMGAVVAARRMNAEGVPVGAAGTSVVLMGTSAMLTLGGLVTAGAVAASVRLGVPVAYAAVTAGLAAAVAVAIGAVLVGLRSDRVRGRTMDVLERILRPFPVDVAGFRRSLDAVAADPPRLPQLASVVGWSAVNWGLDVAVVWLLFRSTGETVPLGVILVGYGVANLGAAVPITPGGLGFVEAGMAGTYAALGVDPALAVAVVFVYRLLSFWLPTVVGVPVYVRGPAPRGGGEVVVPSRPSRTLLDARDVTAGPVLALQGGMEHQPGCEPFDRYLLGSLDAERPVVVLVPDASGPRRRDHTIRLAEGYWERLGAGLRVASAAGDVRDLDALAAADLLVVSGGDPHRLLGALRTGDLWPHLCDRIENGLPLSGASAGAMVLASWLPRLRPPAVLRLVPGLGLLPDVAVAPHYELPLVRRWARRVSGRHPELTIIGIAERTALVTTDGGTGLVAGQGDVTILRAGDGSGHPAGSEVDLAAFTRIGGDLDVGDQVSRR